MTPCRIFFTGKLLPVFALLLAAACATTVAIRVRVPARVYLGGVRTIALCAFETEGEVISPAPMNDEGRRFTGATAAGIFAGAFTDNGYYSIVEGGKDCGPAPGAQAYLYGKCTHRVTDRITSIPAKKVTYWTAGTASARPESASISRDRVSVARRVELTIEYRIMDAASGRVLFSDRKHAQNFDQNGCEDAAVDADRSKALLYLTPWEAIASRLAQKIAAGCIDQIAPHWIVETRGIENGHSQQMKDALRLAKASDWESAARLWTEAAADSVFPGRGDRLHALSNLALYYEVREDFKKSRAILKQCYQLSHDQKYLDRESLVERRQKESNQLKKQL